MGAIGSPIVVGYVDSPEGQAALDRAIVEAEQRSARLVVISSNKGGAAYDKTAAAAMELNGLSQELDRVLIARLPRADGYFSVVDYCKAYRRAGNFPLRRRQIKLIGDIGGALDHYVGKPLVRTALAMMRQPARLAGMSALQDFLERGFGAFRDMGGAQQFLHTIDERETSILDAIVGGSTDPFADPLAFRLSQPSTERT